MSPVAIRPVINSGWNLPEYFQSGCARPLTRNKTLSSPPHSNNIFILPITLYPFSKPVGDAKIGKRERHAGGNGSHPHREVKRVVMLR